MIDRDAPTVPAPRYPPYRIAFCGASGTGKTTAARWLAEQMKLPMNPVGSRSVAKEMGFASPYDVDEANRRKEFQHNLQARKIAWELEHDAFITDRTVLDDLAYTVMHDVKAVDEAYLARAIEHMKRYTHVVMCPVDVFCNTGTDAHRVHDLAYHRIFDAVVNGFCMEWCTAREVWMNSASFEDRKRVLSETFGLLG